MACFQEFEDAGDDFADADWAVEDGCRGRERETFGARGNQHCGHAFDERLDRGVAGKFSSGFQDDHGGHLAFGKDAAGIFGGVHSERLNAAFAEFGAQGRAQSPIASDNEDEWHLAAKL